MLNKTYRFVGIFVLIMLLICIRLFEHKLFYDPFLQFFKTEYLNKPLPHFNSFYLFINLFLRFLANFVLSIAIIYLLFGNKLHVKIASYLYLFLFIILIVVFFIALTAFEKPNYLLVFYVRRFLIQPILLLLLIPGFYFQKLTSQ